MTPRLDYIHHTVHFSVTAQNNPGSLPRILSVFEKASLCPDLVKSSSFTDGQLAVDIYTRGLEGALQDRLAAKLSSLVTVSHVRTEVILRPGRTKLAS
ncbi:hypothetical protein [Emcibacter sp.]|uniref:hypothetical protein n=1 Tax=Emcibacter sp. TaxID=1979954 RepID=UPI002AA94CC8|nr:hypothetical protein [Emcibacter sp.]